MAMVGRLRVTTLALASVVLWACPGAPPAAAEPIVVVVGIRSNLETITLDTLRELYLARQRVWPDGTRAIPVNLPPDSPVRKAFSTRVLGRRPLELTSYWNARYFDGIRPPLALPSPAAVRAYLQSERAAIGYLPRSEVDDSCRVLLTLPPGP